MEIPAAEEVVDETILRIRDGYSDRYKWDGSLPSTFNRFFARCLKTTLNSLRSTERKHCAAPSRLENQLKVLQPTAYELSVKPDDSLAQEQSGPVLATVIATTRIAGKMKIYADRLPRYAAFKNTTTEIAEDIGVKSATIDTFRKRLRKILKEPES
jgi:DNA-directed RNA polymerase specialized sigma24 family protein